MSVAKELVSVREISWGSVIGGVMTVLTVSLLLSTLGTSLGLSIVDPTSDDPVNGAGHHSCGAVSGFYHHYPSCGGIYCWTLGRQ